MRKILCILVIIAFLANTFGSVPLAQADEFRLPAPGVRVSLSPEYNPAILKGIKVHPDNPFQFDFILDKGDSSNSPSLVQRGGQGELKQEATKLIKYFLASLTIPEKDLWVNLSPYEKDRVIPQSFGLTEMGRDLLAEDYMLKQITASLIYPEDAIGKKFWKRVYEEAYKKFGTTNIPVNTFNKVWIVPEKAVVYENAKAGTAYVVEAKLKVMLEQDYLSLEKNQRQPGDMALAVSPSRLPSNEALNVKAPQGNPRYANQSDVSALGSQIVREIVIPELTKEVNEDKNFSQLRQVYNSLILATWYKKKIKDSILAQVYADKNKIQGLSPTRGHVPHDVETIYQRYLQAFKKGVYNYIKEEQDPLTQEIIPRKYFSGGLVFSEKLWNAAMVTTNKLPDQAMLGTQNEVKVSVDMAMAGKDMKDLLKVLVFLGTFMIAGKPVSGQINPGATPAPSEIAQNLMQPADTLQMESKSDSLKLGDIDSLVAKAETGDWLALGALIDAHHNGYNEYLEHGLEKFDIKGILQKAINGDEKAIEALYKLGPSQHEIEDTIIRYRLVPKDIARMLIVPEKPSGMVTSSDTELLDFFRGLLNVDELLPYKALEEQLSDKAPEWNAVNDRLEYFKVILSIQGFPKDIYYRTGSSLVDVFSNEETPSGLKDKVSEFFRGSYRDRMRDIIAGMDTSQELKGRLSSVVNRSIDALVSKDRLKIIEQVTDKYGERPMGVIFFLTDPTFVLPILEAGGMTGGKVDYNLMVGVGMNEGAILMGRWDVEDGGYNPTIKQPINTRYPVGLDDFLNQEDRLKEMHLLRGDFNGCVFTGQYYVNEVHDRFKIGIFADPSYVWEAVHARISLDKVFCSKLKGDVSKKDAEGLDILRAYARFNGGAAKFNWLMNKFGPLLNKNNAGQNIIIKRARKVTATVALLRELGIFEKGNNAQLAQPLEDPAMINQSIDSAMFSKMNLNDENRPTVERIYDIYSKLASSSGNVLPFSKEETVKRIEFRHTLQSSLAAVILLAVAGTTHVIMGHLGFSVFERIGGFILFQLPLVIGASLNLFDLTVSGGRYVGGDSSKYVVIPMADMRDKDDLTRSTAHEMAHLLEMPRDNLYANSYGFLISKNRDADPTKTGFLFANTIFNMFPGPLADQESLLRKFYQTVIKGDFKNKSISMEDGLSKLRASLREEDYFLPNPKKESAWTRSYGIAIAQLALLHYKDEEAALRYIYRLGQQKDSRLADESSNRAMNSSKTGGIDLTPANMNLQTKIDSSPSAQNDKEGIKFYLDPAMLVQLQNAPGFVPVVINIEPLGDLRGFLGVQNNSASRASVAV